MPDINSKHVIEGAMFLRKCSRKKARKWLASTPTEKELQIARNFLKCLPTPPYDFEEAAERFARTSRSWEASLAKTRHELKQMTILSAEDYAIRVGPC